jgi:hypothetical protein
MTFMLSNKARLQWASLLVPAVSALCANAAPVNTPGASANAAAPARVVEYSVVNLGPDAGMAVLNGRDQVAFATWSSPDAIYNGFFDGTCVRILGSLGGPYTMLKGLNKQGVVVGQSQDALLDYRAFSWSVARGMRALPGPTLSDAYAINNLNQIAGVVRAEGQQFYTRANRWDPDGSLTRLGPPPARISTARAINDSGVTVGDSEIQFQDSHAMVWDRAGTATDLTTFGGSQSTATHINASGQVLGTYYKEGRGVGFLWSRQRGMVRIGPDTGDQYVTALNENGEVTGNNLVVDSDPQYRYTPFIWSAGRGMRRLPVAGAPEGRVQALNNRREMVGYLERTLDDPGSRRAVYWNDVANPVDLNTRLYRAPAGLVLYSANAINDNGTIVADSNAGLVLLRPGRAGTAAPVLGAVAGGAADGAVRLGDTVDFSVNFVDSAVAESHVASASVNDACPQAAPSLRERRGLGDVSLRHTFCQAGAFTLKVKVTDRAGNATQVQRRLFVTDPSVATLVGSGALPSADAAAQPGKDALRFAVWAPLDGGTATASRAAPALVNVTGPFQFRAEAVGKPERSGQSVQLTGTGRFNGRPGYRFKLEASPGNGQPGAADRLRLRISHTDAATRAEIVDYDNGVDASAAMARTSKAPDGTLLTQGKLRLAQ